jgi:hypothetical protein
MDARIAVKIHRTPMKIAEAATAKAAAKISSRKYGCSSGKKRSISPDHDASDSTLGVVPGCGFDMHQFQGTPARAVTARASCPDAKYRYSSFTERQPSVAVDQDQGALPQDGLGATCAEAILEAASRNRIDLLVSGALGKRRLGDCRLDETSNHLLKYTGVPILLAH